MNKLLALLRNNKKTERPKALATATEIYLYAPIVSDADTADWCGGVCPDEFVPAIKAMVAPEIHLRMNCPGGDVFAAQAIAQAIREHPSRVICHIDGVAASAATVVACACDSVVMAAGATYMIHKTWTMAVGNSDDMIEMAAMLDKQDGILAAQYADKTGKAAADLLAMMTEETWLTATEAVDIGFANEIFQSPKSAPSASWDLSVYSKAPKPPEPTQPQPEANDAATIEHRERQRQRLAFVARSKT